MTLALYAHPMSAYSQKVLVALYENETPFHLKMLGPETPHHLDTLKRLWPLAKYPLITDDGKTVFEATAIIEYLVTRYPGPVHLIPSDANIAVDVRMMDRIFDNYVMMPMFSIVRDARRKTDARNPQAVTESRCLLDSSYRWLNERISRREWACGNIFTLADCAAAPSLRYADWVHPITAEFSDLRAYRDRLAARRSFARVINEARPYRNLFPLQVPDRD
jgi:glutathione S-transferase